MCFSEGDNFIKPEQLRKLDRSNSEVYLASLINSKSHAFIL